MSPKTFQRYRHAVQFLESVLTIEADRTLSKVDPTLPGGLVGLKRCRRLLDHLGNPQDALHFVHVAGTSGKGSVARMIHGILHAAGVPVGTCMSPHVTTTLERIWMGDGFVPMDTFADCVAAVAPVVEAEYQHGPYGVPSYHELILAVALLAFRRLGCQVAVLEVGIGGRLDSTNIIPAPLAAVITSVGLDHTDLLGPDIDAIARDKAGIIKPGAAVFTGADRDPALQAIRDTAAQHDAPLFVLGEDMDIQDRGATFDVTGPHGRFPGIVAGRTGAHQRRNTALAVATALYLRQAGFPIPDEAIRAGVETAFLPGRFEEVRLASGQHIVLDIAHNVDKIRSVVETWQGQARDGDVAVVSIAGNKDRSGILRILSRAFRRLVVTRPLHSHRTMVSPRTLAQAASPLFDQVIVRLDPWRALTEALSMGGTDVLVTGSTYLASEIREWFEDEETMVSRGYPAPLPEAEVIFPTA